MNKTELIAKVSAQTKLTKTQVAAVIAGGLAAITESLKKGQPVTFVGFGTFTSAQRKARTGFNPRTKGKIKIPARKVARFRPGADLRKAVARSRS